MRVFFIFLFFNLYFNYYVFADIRKNKLIQDTVEMSIKNGCYVFDIQKLLKHKEALNAFISIIEERYKKEKIDGIIVCTPDALSCYDLLAKKLDIPLNFIDINQISYPLKKNGRYIIGGTILEDGADFEKILKLCKNHNAHIMEIICITEILHFKARENLNAQIMSIFIERKTQISPHFNK